MRNLRRPGASRLALACIAAGLGTACSNDPDADGNSGQVEGTAERRIAQASPCTGVGVPPVQQQPVLTGDFSALGDQIGADCMAWQSFIALNWRADPARPGQPDATAVWSDLGAPGDGAPKVWESYWEASAVFGSPVGKKLLWSARSAGPKRLVRESKLDAANLSLSGFSQALDHKWLTSQSGNLTYYEVLVNEDEFDFITTNTFQGNDLTTFAGQAACASQAGQNGRGGFNLPVGGGSRPTAVNDADCFGNPRTYGKNVGAIEIKAAWTALPADGSLNYRYLTAQAQITDPYGKQSGATVGLVGLHIIRRVPGAAQLVWSTFEHIDNSPDKSSNAQGYSDPQLPANPAQRPRPAYTYFNPACQPASDPIYQCAQNVLPGTACPPGQSSGCFPYGAPMQITRVTPVDSKANSVTGYVWSLLPANSVFNYYRLINVQWPANSVPVQPQSTTPLTGGDITPSANVANSTLETFLQSSAASNNCMACHQFASIAQPQEQKRTLIAGRERRKVQAVLAASPTAGANYASSYSFLFLTETRR